MSKLSPNFPAHPSAEAGGRARAVGAGDGGGSGQIRVGIEDINLQIFLCHSTEDHNLADRIATALRGQGHQVFLDRDSLPSGASFDDRIRRGIEKCNLFLFLISPNSVKAGKYTLTELKFSKAKWPRAEYHVLPVMAVATPMELIPPYLANLTVLAPEGNAVAEVLAEVAKLQSRRNVRAAALMSAALAFSVLSIAVVIVYYYFDNFYFTNAPNDTQNLAKDIGANAISVHDPSGVGIAGFCLALVLARY